MAEGETLKLPKPVIEHDIRSDFLPFSDDRRWELMNFIRPDDVEEIKSCEMGPVSVLSAVIVGIYFCDIMLLGMISSWSISNRSI